MNKCEQKDVLCFLTKIKTHLIPTQVITPQFYRREDLTTIVRLRITSIALLFSLHGDITKLGANIRFPANSFTICAINLKILGKNGLAERLWLIPRSLKGSVWSTS